MSQEDEDIISFPKALLLPEKLLVEETTKLVARSMEDPTIDSGSVHKGLKRIRGINYSEFHRNLKRLVGDPIRITGSHYIYDSRLKGRVPVPFHSQDVPIGTLKNILETLGIRPEEIER